MAGIMILDTDDNFRSGTAQNQTLDLIEMFFITHLNISKKLKEKNKTNGP